MNWPLVSRREHEAQKSVDQTIKANLRAELDALRQKLADVPPRRELVDWTRCQTCRRESSPDHPLFEVVWTRLVGECTLPMCARCIAKEAGALASKEYIRVGASMGRVLGQIKPVM